MTTHKQEEPNAIIMNYGKTMGIKLTLELKSEGWVKIKQTKFEEGVTSL